MQLLRTHAVDFAADIRAGLTKPGQKELPSKYLYDTLGSKLFEVIVELPEYGLTRADERLLRGHAHEIVQRIPGDVILCELGSGSGTKDTLDPGSALPPPAYQLLSHRDFARGSGGVPARVGRYRLRGDRRPGARISGRASGSGRPAPGRPAHPGAVSGQHHRKLQPSCRCQLPARHSARS